MTIKGKEKDTDRAIERQKKKRGKEKLYINLYAYTAAYNTSSTLFHGEMHQS